MSNPKRRAHNALGCYAIAGLAGVLWGFCLSLAVITLGEGCIGRVVIARGRDAADVAINTTFGPNKLDSFFVRTHEVRGPT
jgi:hypothetical protein